MTARCAPACSQALPVKPQGVWPEVLKRERGHVTSETGVAKVAVFGALQPNGPTWQSPKRRKSGLWNSLDV